MKETGSIIAELRKEAGYTQKSLADALGITDKAISKWERGICQPDISLLSKLSLLLDAEVDLLLGKHNHHASEWIGVIDLKEYDVNLNQTIYDKPMVYFMLSHYMLLGINRIYFRTSEENKCFLREKRFKDFGFDFFFDFNELPQSNLMILNKPLFLFGSDLTHQFQGAMVTNSLIKLVPTRQNATFLFCPQEYAFMYLKNPEYLYEIASEKNLGRGIISIEMLNEDKIQDVSMFVRIYQNNSKLKIAGLDELNSLQK